MRLVIDIPEKIYKYVQQTGSISMLDTQQVANAIFDGKPLPKGHGRLIDADKEIAGLKEMKVVDEKDKQSVRFAILELEYTKPIIEADKEQE